MSFQVANVTSAELEQLLADVETKGAGIHTVVNRVDAFSGAIILKPKFGFISVTVHVGYSLVGNTLTVTADKGEDQIQQQIASDLNSIRQAAAKGTA